MPVKPCSLCPFVASTLRDLLKHLRQVHAHQPGFEITCYISGCQRKFRNFKVLRNHVYDIHSESVITDTTPMDFEVDSNPSSEFSQSFHSDADSTADLKGGGT